MLMSWSHSCPQASAHKNPPPLEDSRACIGLKSNGSHHIEHIRARAKDADNTRTIRNRHAGNTTSTKHERMTLSPQPQPALIHVLVFPCVASYPWGSGACILIAKSTDVQDLEVVHGLQPKSVAIDWLHPSKPRIVPDGWCYGMLNARSLRDGCVLSACCPRPVCVFRLCSNMSTVMRALHQPFAQTDLWRDLLSP